MNWLLEKYKISEEEVLKWAEKEYPNIKNINILSQLYVKKVKGEKITGSDVVMGPVVPVSELAEEEWSVIEVLVALKIRENVYNGCPECFRSLRSSSTNCENCGEVVPVKHKFVTYTAGDNSGDIILSFPPRIANGSNDLEGVLIKAVGLLKEDGEFIVQRYSKIKETSEEEEVGEREVDEKKIEKKKLKKKESPHLKKEVDLLVKLMNIFQEISLERLEKWHQEAKIKSSLDELIKAAGLRIVGDKVVIGE